MSEVEKKRKRKKRKKKKKKNFQKGSQFSVGRKYLGKLKLVLAVRVQELCGFGMQ